MKATPAFRRTPALLALAVAAAAAAGAPGAALAQGAGRGFLFHEPTGSITLRGGFARASAGSDIFAFTTENLTLGRGDFDGVTVGADFAFRVAPRMDLMFGAAYAGRSSRSEFRKWVDQDNQPIEQRTSFHRTPLTVGARAYLTPRGRSIGSYAWVPARAAYYVGGGGGMMHYRFAQKGDFVDEETLDVFGDEFISSGWTPTAQALAGADFTVNPYFALTAEGRYGWAKAKMDRDFSNFDNIDLSGFTATIGLAIRY